MMAPQILAKPAWHGENGENPVKAKYPLQKSFTGIELERRLSNQLQAGFGVAKVTRCHTLYGLPRQRDDISANHVKALSLWGNTPQRSSTASLASSDRYANVKQDAREAYV